MTTPMKSFSTAAMEAATDEEAPPLSFAVEGDWGREEFTANRPSDGSLMLFAAFTVEDVEQREQMYELMRLYEKVLGKDGFRRMRDLVDDSRVSPLGLLEIFQWLMEEWTAFPTQPPRGSSTSPRGTGGRSTGRAPGKGSTQRASLPAGS